MIYFDSPCERCKHIRPLVDGWNMSCDAFPNGFPRYFLRDYDVTKLKECANGIKFEPKEED